MFTYCSMADQLPSREWDIRRPGHHKRHSSHKPWTKIVWKSLAMPLGLHTRSFAKRSTQHTEGIDYRDSIRVYYRLRIMIFYYFTRCQWSEVIAVDAPLHVASTLSHGVSDPLPQCLWLPLRYEKLLKMLLIYNCGRISDNHVRRLPTYSLGSRLVMYVPSTYRPVATIIVITWN